MIATMLITIMLPLFPLIVAPESCNSNNKERHDMILLRNQKILEDYVCFVSSSEPEKLQTRSIGHNKGVAMII